MAQKIVYNHKAIEKKWQEKWEKDPVNPKVDASGNPQLDNIDSDEEYALASEAFDEMLDSMEYDELVGEDELN